MLPEPERQEPETTSTARRLSLLAEQSARCAPACCGAVATIADSGPERRVTATHPDLAPLASVQLACGDGPIPSALDAGEPVDTEDLLTEERWPGYRALALESGVRSCVTLPFRRSGIEVTVSLYGYRPGSLEHVVRGPVGILAKETTTGLVRDRRYRAALAEVEQPGDGPALAPGHRPGERHRDARPGLRARRGLRRPAHHLPTHQPQTRRRRRGGRTREGPRPGIRTRRWLARTADLHSLSRPPAQAAPRRKPPYKGLKGMARAGQGPRRERDAGDGRRRARAGAVRAARARARAARAPGTRRGARGRRRAHRTRAARWWARTARGGLRLLAAARAAHRAGPGRRGARRAGAPDRAARRVRR